MLPEQLDFVKATLESCRADFEEYLAESFSERKRDVPDGLFGAMEYSLSAGGKRLRPSLCMTAAERCGAERAKALPLALGLEMFHTASLIHDDLPCMDDDDTRRGRPSNHKAFGETTAILAGDSLLLAAFEYPLNYSYNVNPPKLLNALRIFARAAGPSGVCGGQFLDMDESRKHDPEYVKEIASLKTAALIRASALGGAALGTDREDLLSGYSEYGYHLGLAFQIVDDILDVESTSAELGKSIGKDAEQGKITHVTVFGLEQARLMAKAESLAAKNALTGILKEDDFLMLLPEYLTHRTN